MKADEGSGEGSGEDEDEDEDEVASGGGGGRQPAAVGAQRSIIAYDSRSWSKSGESSWLVEYRGTFSCFASSKRGFSAEPCNQQQPMSTLVPRLESWNMRPPMRFRASSTTTRRPSRCKWRAAEIPAMPAPTTMTSVSISGGGEAERA